MVRHRFVFSKPAWMRSWRTAGLQYFLYAARCAAAASLAQMTADRLGLSFPVWATLSALVVSQEKLSATKAAFLGRVFGTLAGMAIAVLSHTIVISFASNVQIELLAAVGMGAIVARRWPMARACMWTAIIILAIPSDETSVASVALVRGLEVLIGCLWGALAHYAADGVRVWAGGQRLKRLHRRRG